MREILFRGKSVNNGRWVFGDLSNYGVCKTITTVKDFRIIDSCEVIPETIGQYTGLTDKNGRKIFEGDICKAYICMADTVEKEVIGTICFQDGTFEFKCEHDSVYIYPLLEVLEVIGNIYDNPELMGGNKLNDDLISRQATLKVLEEFEKQCWKDMCFKPLMSDARVIIKDLPAAQPKTGHWFDVGSLSCRCSECGGKSNRESRYCPNCGAKMETEE